MVCSFDASLISDKAWKLTDFWNVEPFFHEHKNRQEAYNGTKFPTKETVLNLFLHEDSELPLITS